MCIVIVLILVMQVQCIEAEPLFIGGDPDAKDIIENCEQAQDIMARRVDEQLGKTKNDETRKRLYLLFTSFIRNIDDIIATIKKRAR